MWLLLSHAVYFVSQKGGYIVRDKIQSLDEKRPAAPFPSDTILSTNFNLDHNLSGIQVFVYSKYDIKDHACIHCWRPWWSAAWPRPPTKSRYLLSGALHLTTSSIYQRESPMSFFARHQNPFLPELLAAHLVWVPESVLHVNGVFSSRSTSASYRQASYTHLLFVFLDTTPKLSIRKRHEQKKYCQDCGCCPGSFSDCHVTFINLHDLSFSISLFVNFSNFLGYCQHCQSSNW